ncbi:hypothetical protein Harman_07830 [Haloarcula mannanilytica]|uniref:DUF7978 domain-containing protein n=1 Tax=Haloarcula mannanilytica TaxID=2509225 RepID=A0A4C2EEB7_9EURY|nr:hypothetical protein [Haloarcula mannanilytica]GCF12848.1 hypothetical protein Harman_07830 [Haloarcula mannanilytica]
MTDHADDATDEGAGTGPVGESLVDEPPTATAEQPQPESHLLKESLRTFPWLRAAGVAAGTLVVEYLLVALLFLVGPSSVDLPELSDRLVQYGFVLYNAHHVPTLVTATDAEVYGSAARNLLYGAQGASVPPIVYFLIPVGSLLVVGALFERYRGAARTDSLLEEAALVGTGLSFGYVVTGFAGSFVFVRTIVFEGGGQGQAAPAVPWLLLLLFFFPLVFATVGAAAQYAYADRASGA